MAARGHVQDPNDRRLRPIYGEHSMGSCTVLRIDMFVECLWDFMMLPLQGVSGCCESGWRGGLHCGGPIVADHGLCCLQRPMTVHPTRSHWGGTRQPRVITEHRLSRYLTCNHALQSKDLECPPFPFDSEHVPVKHSCYRSLFDS